MKRFTIIVSCALLAACGSKSEAPADPAASASASAAATPAAVYTPAPGSYDYTDADGTKGVTTIVSDGAYVDRDSADKVNDKGKWAVTDGKFCFTPEKGDVRCYGLSTPGADGSFTATNAKGEISQVKPHAK